VFGSAEIANGAPGPTNVDALHREILDGMLRESTWETIGAQLSKSARDEMVLMWHKLDGACTIHYPCVLMITAWPDSARGLVMLKEKMIITTL
jgi:hypothetical protein